MCRLGLVLSVVLVSACSKGQVSQGDQSMPTGVVRAAPADAAKGAGPAVSAPMLAYAYQYDLETAAAQVSDLLARHETRCVAAGPTVCQVTASNIRQAGRDKVEGLLALRATPAWIAGFRDGLAPEVKKLGGRIASAKTDTEDLTRQIVDTEAAIRAKTTLRDRLQAVLANRPGKLSELLEVETALAQVQGEIDAGQSNLAVMRTRVQTSALTINYRARGAFAPEGVAAPLGKALNDVVSITVLTLAGMVRVIAWFLPWGVVLGVGGWIYRRHGKAFVKAPPAQAPPSDQP